MIFATHPRAIQSYRDAKLPTAGIPNFRCQKCGQIATMKRLSGNNKVGTDAPSTDSTETES